MRIKALINGKEITGFWNGKFYKSKKNPEKNIRIYIDNVEYDIPRDQFKYEEVLTEKQQKYAWDLKLKFLEKLDKIFEEKKVKRKCEETIKEYFKNKEVSYFLKNQIHLSPILTSVFARPYIVCSVINRTILDRFKITKNKKDLTEEELNEILLNAFIHSIKEQLLPSHEKCIVFIYEDDEYYYVQFFEYKYLIGINKETKETKAFFDLKLKEKEYIAKLEERE